MSDNNDLGSFLAGFIIGGLVGTAVALLMAPQSGEETRTLIKDKSIELKDRAAEYGADAIGRAEQALEEARVRADEALDELRVRSEDFSAIMKEKAEAAQRAVRPPAGDVAPVEDAQEPPEVVG